jgi:hypothetical protein
LLERDDPAAIHFFFANFTGMRRKLFPELAAAYRKWVETGDPGALRTVVRDGLSRWSGVSADFLALHGRLGDASGLRIEAWLDAIAPEH